MKGTPPVKTAVSLLVTSFALAIAPAASGQLPTTPPTPDPQPEPANLTVKLDAGLYSKGRPYVIKGDKAHVRGTLKPHVAGEKVLVEIFKRGKRVAGKTVTVRGDGTYAATLRVSKDGVMHLWATHKGTAAQKQAKAGPVEFGAIVAAAHVGSSGAKVRLLQKGLARLGYVTHRGGRFDAATARSVIAFRKVNKMSRITRA